MDPKDLKIGVPLDETKLPPALKTSKSKFMDLFSQVMKLPDNHLLPIACPDLQSAQRLYHVFNNSTFAVFRCFQREKTIYVRLWNEKDEEEKRHIAELRELAKQKKATRTKKSENVESVTQP